MTKIVLTLFLIGITSSIIGQDHTIDLGQDTIYNNFDFEYIAAVEMEAFMESYIIYQSARKEYDNGDLFSAKAILAKAIKLNKKESKFKILKAWIHSKEGSYNRAVKISRKILEVEPLNREALYCKALNHFLLRDYLNANIWYSKLIEMDARDYRALYARAETKMKLEDYKGAINDYGSVIIVKPTMIPAYEGRAKAFLNVYDFKLAIRDYNQAITAWPENANLYHFRGVAYMRLNDISQACKNFKESDRLGYKDSANFLNKYCKY